jgi:trigger factor
MEDLKSKDNLKILSGCNREISIEIPADEVSAEFNKTLSQFAGRAKIKGFRPGKTPRDIVKKMYYPDIKESIINSLAPSALNEEFKKHNLRPVGNPMIKEISFEEGQPLRFTAVFEIWPEIALGDYKKIKVKKKDKSVSPEEIDKSIESLREKSAQFMPVEGRGVKDGDYVVVNIQGKDLKENKMLPTEKVLVLSGHQDNEKALNQSLTGLKPEQENEFTVDYDKDHPNKKLAGKKIAYSIKVVSIKEKDLPEVNDDFAKDLGDFEKIKDLKDKIKSELTTAKESESRQEMTDEMLEKIAKKAPFDLPESVVQNEAMAILRNSLSTKTTSQQFLPKEEIERLQKESKEKAEKILRNHLILFKIAEKEKFEITENEITEELKKIAQANNVPLAQVVNSVNQEGKKDELKNNLLIKKTVDFLLENAIIG